MENQLPTKRRLAQQLLFTASTRENWNF